MSICRHLKDAVQWCTLYCSWVFYGHGALWKMKAVTWEVVAQPAGWGSADPYQVVAGMPPHAEGANAEFPAGFLCDRWKQMQIEDRVFFLTWFWIWQWLNRKYRETAFCYFVTNTQILAKSCNKWLFLWPLELWTKFHHLCYFYFQQISRNIRLCAPDQCKTTIHSLSAGFGLYQLAIYKYLYL